MAQQNPFDFLHDTQKQQSLFGSTSKKTLGIFFGGAALLVVILIIILAMAFRGGDSAETTLRSVAARQLEIVRITSINPVSDDTGRDVKALSANIRATVQSDYTQLTSALATRNIAFDEGELARSSAADTTAKIETAVAAGTLDLTVIDVLSSELTAYRNDLSSAYEQTSSQQIRETLQASFASAELLIEQLEAAR